MTLPGRVKKVVCYITVLQTINTKANYAGIVTVRFAIFH